MTSFRSHMRYLNPYDLHKLIINEYILKKPGDTKKFQRDTSKDKNDYHILQKHHKFLWDEQEKPDTWEDQFAKKYYEKLFKEYCIGDLSKFKENRIALRWRIEKEVVTGKGQFICGNKLCNETENLRSWEVNFAYLEKQERKNALVKIRLCTSCSKKLNYHSKKREVKRLRNTHDTKSRMDTGMKTNLSKSPTNIEEFKNYESSSASCSEDVKNADDIETKKGESSWTEHKPVINKSREEEMEDYLQDLLL